MSADKFFRVLKPGGRVGLTTWAEDCPFIRWCQHVLRPYVPPQAPQDQRHPAFIRQRARGHVATGRLYAQAPHEWRMLILPTLREELWASLWSGAIRRQLEAMAAPVLEQAKTELCNQVQVLKNEVVEEPLPPTRSSRRPPVRQPSRRVLTRNAATV